MMKTIPLLLAALALTIHSAKAASGAWTGTTSGNWDVDSNWTGASYPGTGAPEFATFNDDVVNSTVSMNGASISVTGIIFDTNAEAYTFNAGGGSLQAQAISINSSVGAVTQTFNLAVNIDSTAQVNNSSTSAIINLAGGVNNIGASNRLLRFNFAGSGVGTTFVNGLSETGGGTLSIEKLLSGKLILSGNLTNTGANTIRDGIVQLNAAGGFGTGNVLLSGGIIGLGAGDFTRAVGTGANQIRWAAPSTNTATGFAAYGADRIVNLGGAAATLVWDGGSIVIRTDQQLALGSVDSTHKLTFENAINLSDEARTIVVSNGISSTDVDGEISGAISSTISGSGSVIKTGAGTLLLSGTNTYTGQTTVSAGTLLVGNSSGQGSLAGGASVASGAALGGSGSIAGTVTIDGSLRPGNSLGTLTVQDDVTWNGGNDWVFELGTAAATLGDANTGSSTQDQLNITGGGDFLMGTGSDWTFDFDGTGETGWYKVVDWTGTTGFGAGDFTALNLSSGLSGTFTVDAGTSALYLNVIPEPNTWGLLALGVLFLLSFRRRAGSKQDRLSVS